MDGLTFASKIIEAVAWPFTVAFLAFKFRDRVGTLLDKLVGLKLPGGIEANFRDEIAAAERIAEQVELPVSEGQAVASPSPPDPNEVRANPTGVIMESWIALTRTAEEIATLRGYSRSIASSGLSFNQTGFNTENFGARGRRDAFQLLKQNGFLTSEELSLLDDLRVIRNRAAHSADVRPTPEDAERFAAMANRLEVTWFARYTNGLPVREEQEAQM